MEYRIPDEFVKSLNLTSTDLLVMSLEKNLVKNLREMGITSFEIYLKEEDGIHKFDVELHFKMDMCYVDKTKTDEDEWYILISHAPYTDIMKSLYITEDPEKISYLRMMM